MIQFDCSRQSDKDFSQHAIFILLSYLFICGLLNLYMPLWRYPLFKKTNSYLKLLRTSLDFKKLGLEGKFTEVESFASSIKTINTTNNKNCILEGDFEID